MTQQPGFFSDPIGHLREGAERNAAGAGRDKFGNQNDPGWWNNMVGSLTGATDAGTQEYVQAEKDFKNEKTYKSQIEALGGTFTPGMTAGQYGAEVDRLTQNRNNNAYTNSPAGKAAAAQLALQTSELAATNKRLDSQNQITNKRLDQQLEIAQLDRADSKERYAAELEYQKLRDRKTDQQYNERMEQLDRKDRRTAMSSIAAGLASLGAAFAL